MGFASLPLADLLHTSMLEKELQLFDINGQPAGSLVLNLKLHQLSQPKPIRLRIVAKEKGDLNPYCAAVEIQRVHRGRSARKQIGQHLAAEAAAPLVVSVHQIRIDPSVRASVIGPVWVEIDLFGLHATGTKSTQLKPGDAEREVSCVGGSAPTSRNSSREPLLDYRWGSSIHCQSNLAHQRLKLYARHC